MRRCEGFSGAYRGMIGGRLCPVAPFSYFNILISPFLIIHLFTYYFYYLLFIYIFIFIYLFIFFIIYIFFIYLLYIYYYIILQRDILKVLLFQRIHCEKFLISSLSAIISFYFDRTSILKKDISNKNSSLKRKI